MKADIEISSKAIDQMRNSSEIRENEETDFDPLFAYPPMVFSDRDPSQSNWYQIGDN